MVTRVSFDTHCGNCSVQTSVTIATVGIPFVLLCFVCLFVCFYLSWQYINCEVPTNDLGVTSKLLSLIWISSLFNKRNWLKRAKRNHYIVLNSPILCFWTLISRTCVLTLVLCFNEVFLPWNLKSVKHSVRRLERVCSRVNARPTHAKTKMHTSAE